MNSEPHFRILKTISEVLEKEDQIEIWETDIKNCSDNALLSRHKGVIDALETDDKSGADKTYNVRGTSDWKEWADALEHEMDNRKLNFKKIPW